MLRLLGKLNIGGVLQPRRLLTAVAHDMFV
jgi:hypothetical protein